MINLRRMNRGFTLIEILVVISIFAIILLIANQILFSAFRGSSKAEATTRVKREGERVFGLMERSIRNSRAIISCNSSQITYQDQYGVTASFVCRNVGTPNIGEIAAGSAALAPITVNDVDVTACSFSCETVGGINKAVLINATFVAEALSTSARVEERGSISLQSRILLRN
ncbi:MAG: prepilin-type N-terminal cleavage/methylation domain-containing protein [Patescibacteria group bacterium]